MSRLIIKLEQDQFSVSERTPMLLDFKIEYAHPKKTYEFSRECFTETSAEIINQVFSDETPINVTIKRHDSTYVEDIKIPVVSLQMVILVPAYQPLPLLTKVFNQQMQNYENCLDEHEDIIPKEELDFEHMKIGHHRTLWNNPCDVIKEIILDKKVLELNYEGIASLTIDDFEYDDVSELGITALGFENKIKFSIEPRKFTYLDDMVEEDIDTALTEWIPGSPMPAIIKSVISGDGVMYLVMQYLQSYDRYYYTSNPAPRVDGIDSIVLTRMPNYGVPYVPTQ